MRVRAGAARGPESEAYRHTALRTIESASVAGMGKKRPRALLAYERQYLSSLPGKRMLGLAAKR
jgi:hypothetical protein